MNYFIPYKAIKENVAGCIDIPAVKKLIEIAGNLADNAAKETKGGIIGLCDKNSHSVVIRPIGEIFKEKHTNEGVVERQAIKGLMERFGFMLSWGYIRPTDVRSSILFNNLFVSFYGFFNPLLNEALSLIYAMYFTMAGGDIPLTAEMFRSQAKATVEKQYSDNPYILPMLEEFLPWYASERLAE